MVYRAKGLRLLGVAQFIIGVLMIILAIASFAALDYWISYIGSGIWVGLWVGLTGLFAFLGARSDNSPNNCLIGVMIGFAVTACVEAGTMIILYAIALSQLAQRLRCPKDLDRYGYHHTYPYQYGYDNDCYWRYRYNRAMSYSEAQGGAALCSLLLILAVVEFFVALASSIYGCNACCCTGPTIQSHQQVAYLQQPGGNVIVINPHGVVPVGPGGVQTISTYQGQVLPVIQSAQPQTFVTSPQGIPQQGQPMQAFQAYPTSSQTGGAYGMRQPQQAFQDPQVKQGDMPPPYNFNG